MTQRWLLLLWRESRPMVRDALLRRVPLLGLQRGCGGVALQGGAVGGVLLLWLNGIRLLLYPICVPMRWVLVLLLLLPLLLARLSPAGTAALGEGTYCGERVAGLGYELMVPEGLAEVAYNQRPSFISSNSVHQTIS